MAMMDYGAIAFKNGKCIQTDIFTTMIDMVGWEDTKDDYDVKATNDDYAALRLKNNYFAYIGDKYLTIAFYKKYMKIVRKVSTAPHEFECKEEWFGWEHFKHWTKWTDWGFANAGEEYHIKVTKHNGYYVCKLKYKGDKYKAYFGYGVDYPYYKKWHMVNYYRCPKCLWRDFKWWIKNQHQECKFAIQRWWYSR